MVRVSKTVSKASKAKARRASQTRSRKTAKTKRLAAPEGKPRKHRSLSDLEAQLRHRTLELNEAQEQQAATAEILKIINTSQGNLAPVFDIILEKAHHLCDVTSGSLQLLDGEYTRAVAVRGMTEPFEKYLRQGYRVTKSVRQHVDPDRVVQHIDLLDVLAQAPDEAALRAAVDLGGIRSFLTVPLVKDGTVLGRIVAARKKVQPFTDKQIALLKSFAAQAVIAIENARLFNETQQALERQTATADVLKVISRSAFDLQSVFRTLVESAVRLCGAKTGMIFQRDGEIMRLAAADGATQAFVDYVRDNPIKPTRSAVTGRAALEGRTIHILDVEADPEYGYGGRSLERYRTIISVPLMRDATPIGVFTLWRHHVEAFTDRQLALVETFADQAVIAIENARLFNETQEALERQTATSDILRVISQSPTDVQPVFDSIVTTAVRLLHGDLSFVMLCDRSHYWVAAAAAPDGLFHDLKLIKEPIDPGSNFPSRAIVEKRALYLPDWSLIDLPAHERQIHEKIGVKSALYLPLLRDGECIGLLTVGGKQANIFGEKEIGLAESFRDQALIAIENVRLFNETREALEQQNASADILGVISNSVADAQPVFDKILESCKHLFGGDELDVLLVDEQGQLNIAAYIGDSHDVVAATFPAPVELTPAGRAIRERKAVHWPDLVNGENVPGVLRKMAKLIGYRSMVFAPMLKGDRGIGAIGVARSTGPFKPKELAMLQTFADQAVIAIENARLFNETKEALERQTATADILKVIASSPSDIQPVFEAIATSANRLVGGFSSTVFRFIDGVAHLKAFTPTTPAADQVLQTTFPRPVADFPPFQMAQAGEVTRIPDTEALSDEIGDIARARGFRSMLFAPLMNDGVSIGLIAVTRVQPFNFTDHHVQLLRTFADQAVIAIENVRLFEEVQARTRELSQSLDDLRTAQDRLVQTEKLASLGQLTAGIAHEIKNPLNFVNNFSALSAELIEEMTEVFENSALDEVSRRKELDEIRELLKSNLAKVVQHGKRADSIVKNMLLHSREGSGEHRPADINALLDESLNLAYHGARAEKSDFNITLQKDFDNEAGMLEVFPQEITRAFLNFISNGFYAAIKRKAENGNSGFEPALRVTTRDMGQSVEIRIRDNGTGIPAEVKEKMFNPFFTTKPAGEGTGLGLSMSHDIIVKQHGGAIDVATEPGQFTEFIVTLPRTTITQKAAGGTN
jgi:two-component system NtrC family sensor kinase